MRFGQVGRRDPRSVDAASSRSAGALPARSYAPVGVPQLPQNLVPGARSLPQLAHLAMPTGVPQFEQNFSDPTGLPQFVHTVARDETSPLNWLVLAIAWRIWDSCTEARSASISVASLGASLTHRPRSSFQHVSSTHRWSRGPCRIPSAYASWRPWPTASALSVICRVTWAVRSRT